MIIFHHDDLDGRASAAIVGRMADSVNDRDAKPDYVELSYKDDFPFDMIGTDEEVWIVDYSIKLHEMEKLLDVTRNVIWIDHHKTAIDNYKHFNIHIDGVRSVEKAACELCWEYLRPHKEMPMGIRFIGDRDAWKWKLAGTAAFTAGMMVRDQNPSSEVWDDMILKNVMLDIVPDGEVVLKFLDGQRKAFIDAHAFRAIFSTYLCLAVNVGRPLINSELFGEEFHKYPFVMGFVFDGERYIYHLYSSDKREDSEEQIDVGEIAERYDGGGHKGAAGFISNELLLRKI